MQKKFQEILDRKLPYNQIQTIREIEKEQI